MTKRKIPPCLWLRGDTYWCRFRHNGKQIREPLSNDLKIACDLLAELKGRAVRGEYNLLDNHYPFIKLRNEFVAWAKQTKRDWKQYETSLRHIEEFRAIGLVSEIDKPFVLAFREAMLNVGRPKRRPGPKCEHPPRFPLSPRTINREVGILINMLNRGVEWKRIKSNEIASLEQLHHDHPVKERRSLTCDEVVSIFQHSPPELLPLWRFFCCTGVRRDELVDLKWSDIDWGRQVATVRRSSAKNHKMREIPLDEYLSKMLLELREKAKDRQPVPGKNAELTKRQARNFSREHVFVTRANTPHRNNLLRKFYSVCKKAGIEDAKRNGSIDLHALRVSFATLSLDGGANPKDVQAILGHSTLALTMQVYAKSRDSSKRAAISSLPFAQAAIPEGIIPFPSAHNVSTSKKDESQTNTG